MKGLAMLIDTHLHLIDRKHISYPWLKDVPALDQDWSYEAYEAEARRLGISAALHMEADCAPEDIGKETAWITKLIQRPDSLIKGAISAARPEGEGFDTFLDRLDRQVIKGIRRVLHVMPDDVSRSDGFRSNIRKLGQAGLPFDMCVLARQLPLAIDLADSCEGTAFVLDHCGVPDIAGGGFDAWARAISQLARRPNVNAKISGISAYAASSWTLDTLRPYIEHVIVCFGWSRVVWGSDSPVCTLNSNLSQWVAATRALFNSVSEAERNALFSKNARRIWKI